MSQYAHPDEIRALVKKHKLHDYLFMLLGLLCLFIGILAFSGLLLNMALDGLPRLNADFFFSFSSRRASSAGIFAAWVGSFFVMLVTALTAVPLGIAAGVYLEEYAAKNWITDIIEINTTNLAGIPSIIYGLLGLGLFVYQFGFGRSILSAGLTLALLILPVVIVATRESIRAIPISIREAAFGIGATKWQMVSQHVVPYSMSGILTGVIIGLARAIGETAPLIVIGASTFIAFLPADSVTEFISFAWLTKPFTVMPIQMFNWVSRPEESFQVNAAAAGLVLILMTLLMNGMAIWLRYHLRKKIKW